MELRYYHVDAFTKERFQGNPAGVVMAQKGLDEKTMQMIANDLNLSETVFVEQIDVSRVKLRYFTPNSEVDLCGHATIAAFYTLLKLGYLGEYTTNTARNLMAITAVGELNIEIIIDEQNNIYIEMEQKEPKIIERLNDIEKLAEILGIDIEDIGLSEKYIAPAIATTGLKDILVPVKDYESLQRIIVDNNALIELCKELDVIGVHAFSIEGTKVFARNFAPLVGIDEEAATGTSNGALCYLLYTEGYTQKGQIKVQQGKKGERTGEIIARISEKESLRVIVGGSAVILIEGIIRI